MGLFKRRRQEGDADSNLYPDGAIHDFQRAEPVPQASIEAYGGSMPSHVLDMWQTYGYGSFCDGYFKVIDPEKYRAYGAVISGQPGVPVFATALADVVICHPEKWFLFQYRRGIFKILGDTNTPFTSLLTPNSLADPARFDWGHYPVVREKLGAPAWDECFGYVPLLSLGGYDRPESMQKMKLYEHLAIIQALQGLELVAFKG